jgi:hypothetical protein
MSARNHPTPAEVRRFMRLSERLQAEPGAKLTRAESALLRRMLGIARTIYEHETDFSIPEIEIKPQRTWQNW